MQNIIDVSNHILKYSQVYTLQAPVTNLVREEALQLCLKHGEEFVINYIENYLTVEETHECDSHRGRVLLRIGRLVGTVVGITNNHSHAIIKSQDEVL